MLFSFDILFLIPCQPQNNQLLLVYINFHCFLLIPFPFFILSSYIFSINSYSCFSLSAPGESTTAGKYPLSSFLHSFSLFYYNSIFSTCFCLYHYFYLPSFNIKSLSIFFFNFRTPSFTFSATKEASTSGINIHFLLLYIPCSCFN